MSKPAETKAEPRPSSGQPSHQDALDLLIEWVGMAQQLGLGVVANYAVSSSTLVIRVPSVVANGDGTFVVANDAGTGGKRMVANREDGGK